MAEGPQRVPPVFFPSAGASGPLTPAAAPRLPAPPPGDGVCRALPHRPAWPGQHPTLGATSYSCFSSGARGRAGGVRWGLFLSLFPSDQIILVLRVSGAPLPPDHASINPSIQGWKCPGATGGSSCSSCRSSLPRPGRPPPALRNCSDSTETGFSSNNVF